MMTDSQISAGAYRAKVDVGYNEKAKKAFLAWATKLAHELALRMGVDAANYKARKNEGGIAVSGEVLLFTQHVFVSIEQCGSEGFYYRTCDKLGDSGTGMIHRNRWIAWGDLAKDPTGTLQPIVKLFKLEQERKQGTLA